MLTRLFVSVLSGIIILSISVRAEDQTEDTPTVVFGAAATPDGAQNTFWVEQPTDAPNPLGNPIATPDTPPRVFDTANTPDTLPHQTVFDSTAQQIQQNQGSLPAQSQALGKDFQNTLLEANGRVYDVQSYPEQDFGLMNNAADPQTIYSPNVND